MSFSDKMTLTLRHTGLSSPCPPAKTLAAGPPGSPARSSLRDGTELDTLADAANFILALPEHYQDRNSWKRATELLMQAAEQDGDIEAATEQFERALFLEASYVRR
jgi:hypothetical protein